MSEELNKPIKVKPLINDAYWFQVAKNLVDDSYNQINRSAERFEKLILWLWGIYTPLVGLGASGVHLLSRVNYNLFSIILLVVPSIVLLFAYWFTTKASSSVLMKIKDHRSPEMIKEAFNDSLKKKGFDYLIAQILAGIACALIPIALLVSHIQMKQEIQFSAKLDESKRYVMVNGFFPDKEKVRISINRQPAKEYSLINSILQIQIPFDIQNVKGNILEVYAEWKEGDVYYRIIRREKH